ncbi:MAG: dihydroxyacetone kinase phosphoryl donor subunit DhaM [Trueperella sp.]|nr:dihydroxyacetone kinase phosphoryl donor subunit DhaM [Trueperella sp.]
MADVGLVVVSHSYALATAARELAKQMASQVRIEVAAGIGAEFAEFGTDAEQISQAIMRADAGDGVVVLLDLGSAVMSAELALEFLDPEIAHRTQLIPAPLVEGLIVASVAAAAGVDTAAIAREACQALEPKKEDLGNPGICPAPRAALAESADLRSVTLRITDPNGLHARPAAALVSAVAGTAATAYNVDTGSGPVDATSMTALMSLGLVAGQRLQISVPATETETLHAVAELAERGWNNAAAKPKKREPVPAHQPSVPSSGLQPAVGPALVWRPHQVKITVPTAGNNPDNQAQRWEQAVETVRNYLVGLPEDSIVAIQIGLLSDPQFNGKIAGQIAQGTLAEQAVRNVTGELEDMYAKLPSDYLRQRAEDIVSLGELLRVALTGSPLGGLAEELATWETPPILVLEALSPALAAEIDPARVAGVLTASGSRTGHGALIAAAKGIPVVTGQPQARNATDGVQIALDLYAGEALIEPSPEQLRQMLLHYREANARQLRARKRMDEPALTAAGTRILVEANIATLTDATAAAQNGADGMGLVRTELLFANHSEAPDCAAQTATYIALGKALPGTNPMVVRTWDIGGDKPVAFLPLAAEDNPFLGERGVRLMRRHPELFLTQLRAIVRAGQEVQIAAMIPMVTSVDEIRWAREMLNKAVALEGNPGQVPQLGMMLETPAAAYQIADFAGEVDFVSVGTNDLVQYMAAADRSNSAVAEVAQTAIPAVIRLIAQACETLPCPVSVCGDLASDLELVAELVAAGVDALSVRPALVPEIKQAVRES